MQESYSRQWGFEEAKMESGWQRETLWCKGNLLLVSHERRDFAFIDLCKECSG